MRSIAESSEPDRATTRTASSRRRRPGSHGGEGSRGELGSHDEQSSHEEPPGDPEAVARIVCLRMLDQRARSRAELAGALLKKGISDEAAERVLDRFAEVGLLDDAALAQTIAGAQHRERGLARRAVAAKLRQRGFDDEVVGEALSVIDSDDERHRAVELVARRQRALAGLPAQVQTRRLVGLLGRKGYPPGLVWEVVRAAVPADRADDETPIDDS